jgi:endonuclease/exonuclease/phosphatase family metal-dependent hydrolase
VPAARRSWWPAFQRLGRRLDEPFADRPVACVGRGSGAASARFRRVPVFALDPSRRGFRCVAMEVPRGKTWARMSDHLPLVVELESL